MERSYERKRLYSLRSAQPLPGLKAVTGAARTWLNNTCRIDKANSA